MANKVILMVRLERPREYVEQFKVMKNYSAEEFTKNALVHAATERSFILLSKAY